VREKKYTDHNRFQRSFLFLFKAASQKGKIASVRKKDKWKLSYHRPLL